MKASITILLFLLTVVSNAQEMNESAPKGNFIAMQVSHLAIFPGCEKEGIDNKAGLTRCFAQKLNERLGDKLNNFGDEFRKEGFSAAYAKIRFVINTEGKIVNVKHLKDSIAIEANEKLGTAAELALIDISNTIKYIVPAKTEDTINVNLQFDLPVTWKSGHSDIEKLKWEEFVGATMYDGEKKYEVRKLKDNDTTNVYLMDGLNEQLVKTFETIKHLKISEDYGKIFENNQEKGLMVDRNMNYKQHIRIYFSKQDTSKFEVYSVEQEKETLREIVTMEDLICSDLYLKAILR